jgi:hypothetical protein
MTDANAMPDQRSIDDQLIDAVYHMNMMGLHDAADWIKKQVEGKVDKKIAEVGEPRECRQAVNRFGHLLMKSCGQIKAQIDMGDPHGAPKNYCIDSSTECLHHEPLYAESSVPPAPEPSRSDAEVAVVSNDGYITTPKGEGYCRESILPFTRCGDAHQHIGLVADRDEILEALRESRADLERQMDVVQNQYRGMERQLATAEQWAKDTDQVNNDLRGERVEKIKQIATLTRKLETARQGVAQVVDCCRDDWDREMARKVLAAIDAPAAEDTEKLPYRTCGQILCQAVSAIGAECTLHRDPPHSQHVGVQTAWVDAPHPEPANAHGSEAGDRLPEPHEFCGGVGCNMCKAPSPLPFTAEEALGHALWHETRYAVQREHAIVPDGFRLSAEQHAKVAITLRRYADMLDRDDALERAAEFIVATWDDGCRGTALESSVLQLRSALQRAKELT